MSICKRGYVRCSGIRAPSLFELLDSDLRDSSVAFIKPGAPIYEQVVYAATKSIICGQLRPGDEFPSVRALSKQLKINPNTAHKVVARLADAGLLEIRPGSVAIVAKRSSATKAERTNLLEQQFEELVVEGKRLGIDLQDMQEAIAKHWARLTSKREGKQDPGQGGRQQ